MQTCWHKDEILVFFTYQVNIHLRCSALIFNPPRKSRYICRYVYNFSPFFFFFTRAAVGGLRDAPVTEKNLEAVMQLILCSCHKSVCACSFVDSSKYAASSCDTTITLLKNFLSHNAASSCSFSNSNSFCVKRRQRVWQLTNHCSGVD